MGRSVAATYLDRVVLFGRATSFLLLCAMLIGAIPASYRFQMLAMFGHAAYFLPSAIKTLTPTEEIDAKLLLFDGLIVLVPCVLLYSEPRIWELSTLGAGIPSTLFLTYIVRVFVEMNDSYVCLSPPRAYVFGPPVIVAAVKMWRSSEVSIFLQTIAVITPFMLYATVMVNRLKDELLTARADLKQEMRRLADENADLQAKNTQLVGTLHATRSILTALCDNVATLDSSLRIVQPSGQLCELLQPNYTSTSDNVSGRKFLDFVASEEETPHVNRWLNSADSLSSSCSRVAAAFNMWMKDTKEQHFRVEAFHASFSIGDERSTVTHLVALRKCVYMAQTGARQSTTSAEPPVPLDSDLTSVHTSSGPHRLSCDRSAVAVRFDAGDEDLGLLSESFLDTFLRPSRGCSGLLHWMDRADGARFVETVSRHVQYAPWDRVTHVPLGHPVVFRIPRSAGYITAEMAVLEMEPMTNERGHDIPVTLWLRGLSVFYRHDAGSPLPELSCRVDEDRSSDWCSESVCSEEMSSYAFSAD
eukprot:TRINITY_DN18894_c0_g2_i1.p1 TRINITY_DN18894_c0_g2~~TRINITY_DN18894_c0_g2_i1.p1  ORF type:complete len:530 (-),score=52.01 TRINITY_DN18894_c0_g2_i1:327-1916(-)